MNYTDYLEDPEILFEDKSNEKENHKELMDLIIFWRVQNKRWEEEDVLSPTSLSA